MLFRSFLPAMETDGEGKLVCPCGNHYPKPLSLVGEKSRVLLFDGAKLFDDNVNVCAEVVRNKKNPALWGLKNLTESDWSCVLPNGTEKTVPVGSAAPIFTGTSITVGDEKFNVED